MTRLPDNIKLDGVTRAQAQEAWDSLTPEQQRALLASESKRQAPQKRKASLGDIAKDKALEVGKDYAKQYAKEQLYGSGGAAATEYAGGAGLAGAGAVAEGGSAAGSVAGGAASGASGTPTFDVGAPSYAGYAAAAMDAYKGYKNLQRKNVSSDDKATRLQQDAALAVADVYTGGLAGLAEGYARGQWGGSMQKLDKLDQRTNPGTMVLSKLMGGLSKGQAERRGIRDAMKKAQFINEDGVFQFSHGGTYNTEAGTKDEWKIDPAAGDNARALSQVNPLAAFMTGRSEGDIANEASGYLANATSRSGGEMRANARELYEKAGYNFDSANAAADQLRAEDRITDEQLAAYKAGILDVFGGPSSTTETGNGSGAGKGDGASPAQKKKKKDEALLASLIPEPIKAPDYSVNLSPLVSNPYL